MKTTQNVINCQQRNTYMVKFRWQLGNAYYIVQSEGLMNVLKNEDKNGIEFIKVLDPSSAKFVRSSKNDILNEFSFDTEMALYLSKHYYFR